MEQRKHIPDPYWPVIDGCLKNDRLAQKTMYDKLASRMYPVCIRYVGDRELAKDILHDGFMTLFSKLHTYRRNGSFEGWARRIFINTALMQLRKDDVLKFSQELESAESMHSTSGLAIENMETKTLLNIIMSMPAGYRTVFNMYAIEGYSHSEIAKALGITEGGARSQFSRARAWLQEKLRREDYGR